MDFKLISTIDNERWSSFYDELSTALASLQKRDPTLGQLFEAVTVNWPKIIKPPYVALIGAIIGQKISYKQARTIRGKIYQIFGFRFSTSDIENVTDSALRRYGLNTRMINIIRQVDAYIDNNRLALESAADLRKLAVVRGIGPWTINTAILTSMTDWTVFPTNDLFIKKRVQKLYKLAKMPSSKELEIRCKDWAPYQGVVCWYLWRWFP